MNFAGENVKKRIDFEGCQKSKAAHEMRNKSENYTGGNPNH